MFFNKSVLILSVLSLFSCGLDLGEDPPPVPKYQFRIKTNECSNLNYRDIAVAYFFKKDEDSLRSKFPQVLECISDSILKTQKIFKNTSLEKEEFISLLNEDFVKTKNVKPIIDHITSPDYFDNYILLKRNILHLIEQVQNGKELSTHSMCYKQKNQIVFTKKDQEVFITFLRDLTVFFTNLEKDSQTIYEDFFVERATLENSQTGVEKSLIFNSDFLLFLSYYFKERFPAYSDYLDDQFLEIHYDFNSLQAKDSDGLLQKRKDILSTFNTMVQMPFSESNHLNSQNIKYILLNLYITKALFDLYDTNKDSILNSEELKSLECITTILISLIISPELKEGWSSFFMEVYDPSFIFSYILKKQDIPSKYSFSFFWYRFFYKNELPNLTYTEVSSLISFIFLTFFDRDFIELIVKEELAQNEKKDSF